MISQREVTRALDKIPPFSPVVARALKALQNPLSSVSDIAKEIAKDSILTAEILRLVNSPLFGLSRKVISLEHAIVLLGFRTVEKILMGVGVKKALDIELENYKIVRGELSARGFVGGMVARKMASEIFPEVEDLAFISGILRVLGKVAMNWIIGLKKTEFMQRIKNANDLDSLERKIFGISSHDLTLKAVKKLGVGDEVVEVLKWSKFPSSYRGDNEYIQKASAIVHIADGVTQMAGIGAGVDTLKTYIDLKALDILRLSESDVSRWIEECINIFKILEEEGIL